MMVQQITTQNCTLLSITFICSYFSLDKYTVKYCSYILVCFGSKRNKTCQKQVNKNDSLSQLSSFSYETQTSTTGTKTLDLTALDQHWTVTEHFLDFAEITNMQSEQISL